jgi:hypothetical protein
MSWMSSKAAVPRSALLRADTKFRNQLIIENSSRNLGRILSLSAYLDLGTRRLQDRRTSDGHINGCDLKL